MSETIPEPLVVKEQVQKQVGGERHDVAGYQFHGSADEPLILLLGGIYIRSLYLMSGIDRWLTCTAHSFHDGPAPGSVNDPGDAGGDHRGRGRRRDHPRLPAPRLALLLVLFDLCAAVIGHPYWSITNDATARWARFVHFWKDIEFTGGALFVLARRAGPLSVDQARGASFIRPWLHALRFEQRLGRWANQRGDQCLGGVAVFGRFADAGGIHRVSSEFPSAAVRPTSRRHAAGSR